MPPAGSCLQPQMRMDCTAVEVGRVTRSAKFCAVARFDQQGMLGDTPADCAKTLAPSVSPAEVTAASAGRRAAEDAPGTTSAFEGSDDVAGDEVGASEQAAMIIAAGKEVARRDQRADMNGLQKAGRVASGTTLVRA